MIYQHLAVAIDDSRTSFLALEHAIRLAKITQGRLILITVVSPAEFIALSPEIIPYENYKLAAEAEGKKLLEKATHFIQKAGLQKIDQEIIITSQSPSAMASKLLHRAEALGAQILVLGTHGRTGLKHLLVGSFAETVMRQAKLPLLILPSKLDKQDNKD
ncbi:MAG: universal stress protein [Neisseriaceae bacterium]